VAKFPTLFPDLGSEIGRILGSFLTTNCILILDYGSSLTFTNILCEFIGPEGSFSDGPIKGLSQSDCLFSHIQFHLRTFIRMEDRMKDKTIDYLKMGLSMCSRIVKNFF